MSLPASARFSRLMVLLTALSSLLTLAQGKQAVRCAAAAEDPSPAKPKPVARNAANDWVSYHTRETSEKGAGPRLVVEFEDGSSKDRPAAADALLIAYLPDRVFGRHPELSISLADHNRALVRFDPPAGKVRKAELVLTLVVRGPKEPPIPLPPEPFELAVYEVREAWDEARVTWGIQPQFGEKPALTARVDAKAKELRLDVTALVRGAADKPGPRHGWLLKVANPMKGDDPTPGNAQQPESDLLALFPWAPSVEAARAAARTGKKFILASVRADHHDGTNFSEQMLLAAGLADPDVRALVLARFVPVRVRYPAGLYVGVHEGKDVPFGPLGELGTTLKDAKAPALVVATADGKAVATLASIGTFDRALFLRLLLDAVKTAGHGPGDEKDPWKLLARGELDQAGKAFAGADGREGRYGQARVASLRGDHKVALELCLPLARADGAFRREAMVQAAHEFVRLGRFAEAEPLLRESAADGPRAAEAGYLLGCVLYRSGDRGKAAEVWRGVVKKHPRSPDAARAQARLTWAEAVASYESLTVPDVPVDPTRTEIDRTGEEETAVRRAVEYLLAHQGPDGSWTTPSQTETYRVAITALAARALHLWSAKLDGGVGGRARAASEKATAWLNQGLGRENPETCNSFGAAYLLDYFVDLEETKAAVRGNTKGALALLLGGQCPNGAWSYDLRFGVNWRGGFGGWPATDQGRTHSINTGPALLALARAKNLGHDVDAKALEAGRKALLTMRGGAGVYTYTYPVPESFKKADQSVGRGCVCEHALRRLDAASVEDMESTIACFLTYRDDLRMPVKLSTGWLPPRMVSSYFYFYAYDHAARAIFDHQVKAAERLALLREDILKVGEADGTWVDCETYGKPYGTAMALHVLYLAREARQRAKDKP